jgi:hypothetical protein
MDAIIDAIPGTWSADQPKKYEPVSVSRLVMGMRLEEQANSDGRKGRGICNEAICSELRGLKLIR